MDILSPWTMAKDRMRGGEDEQGWPCQPSLQQKQRCQCWPNQLENGHLTTTCFGIDIELTKCALMNICFSGFLLLSWEENDGTYLFGYKGSEWRSYAGGNTGTQINMRQQRERLHTLLIHCMIIVPSSFLYSLTNGISNKQETSTRWSSYYLDFVLKLSNNCP